MSPARAGPGRRAPPRRCAADPGAPAWPKRGSRASRPPGRPTARAPPRPRVRPPAPPFERGGAHRRMLGVVDERAQAIVRSRPGRSRAPRSRTAGPRRAGGPPSHRRPRATPRRSRRAQAWRWPHARMPGVRARRRREQPIRLRVTARDEPVGRRLARRVRGPSHERRLLRLRHRLLRGRAAGRRRRGARRAKKSATTAKLRDAPVAIFQGSACMAGSLRLGSARASRARAQGRRSRIGRDASRAARALTSSALSYAPRACSRRRCPARDTRRDEAHRARDPGALAPLRLPGRRRPRGPRAASRPDGRRLVVEHPRARRSSACPAGAGSPRAEDGPRRSAARARERPRARAELLRGRVGPRRGAARAEPRRARRVPLRLRRRANARARRRHGRGVGGVRSRRRVVRPR